MTSEARRRLWARLGIPADYARRAAQRIHPEARRLVFIGRNPDNRWLPRAPLVHGASKEG